MAELKLPTVTMSDSRSIREVTEQLSKLIDIVLVKNG
jgi:acetolactate synthase regulatory subunit